MFDFVRKHTRLLQFVLVLLIFPSFVFFGIQGYRGFNDDANLTVGHVDGKKITQLEWDAAQREQIERVRRQMPDADMKLFDTPEMKAQALDGLVRDRVMLAAADKLNLSTDAERLKRLFWSDPQFAFLQTKDGKVNEAMLQAQGMSEQMFFQRLRQDYDRRQVMLGINGSAIAPHSSSATAFDALYQQREVQVQRFDTPAYAAKVNPSDADIEAYYKNPAHAAQFEAPEEASIEYVVLDLDAISKGISVPEEELRKFYDENLKNYTAPEERRASHILVKSDKGAPAAERAKAKAKAEALLAELGKGAVFADLARKNSDDPGSAEKGGDLDFFGRAAMVKPFEDAAFALKAGQTSGVVESDFGYHIIRVTALRGGDIKPFDAVKPEIEAERKKQLAQSRYAELAVEFTNLVYEQPDSLKPAVDKFKLELRSAKGVTRVPSPDAVPPLSSPKFLEAVFGSDALRNKRNTEALEVGPNRMVSGRVLQYTAAHQRPLTEVRAAVREKVIAAQAAALARKDGEARLAALRAAPDTALSEAAQTVSRAQADKLPRPVVDASLKAPADKLPAVIGVDLAEQGYAVVKLTKLLGRDPVAADAARVGTEYAKAWADAESQAYYAALKTRLKVDLRVPAAAASSALN